MASKIAKNQQIKKQERIIHVEEFSIKVSRRGQRVTKKSKKYVVALRKFLNRNRNNYFKRLMKDSNYNRRKSIKLIPPARD